MCRSRSESHTKRSRPAALLVILALVAVLVAACGGDDEEAAQTQEETAPATTESSEGGASAVIGHVNPNLSNPILQALSLGQERAAEALGWEFRALDADLTPEKQVTELDNLVNLDVNGITTWTLDPGAAEAAYKRASDAGIPIVGFNSESQYINTAVTTELATSCEPFQYEAEYIAERIPDAKVIVIGPPPVPALQNRVKCFTEAAEQQGLTILEQQDNLEDTAQRGQEVTQNMLTKNPDTEAVWGYNDPSALGASAALRAAGKEVWSGDTEGVIVIGNNADPDAIEAIEAGGLTLTYDENTFDAGVEAIKAFIPVIEDGEPASAMPKEAAVKGFPIDLENVDEWVPADEQEVDIEG